MTVFQKTKQCTGSFPCRFRMVLLISALLLTVAVITVPLFVG